MQSMIYLHRYTEIKEKVVDCIPEDARIRKLGDQDALCILPDQWRRTHVIDDLKRHIDTSKHEYIQPVKCFIESASHIEVILAQHTVSFAKFTSF